MSKKQTKHHCTVTFTGVGEARIDDLTQEQAWQIQDVCRLIERKPPNYSARGDLLYYVTTEVADERQASVARSGFLSCLMRRFNTWAMGGCVIVFLLIAQDALAQEKPRRVCDKSCEERFRKEWRESATSTVRIHLKRHPDCDLKGVIEMLEGMQLFFPDGMPETQPARAFPKIGDLNPVIFINPAIEWEERRAVVTLIHESTHVTRRRDRWLCGPDTQTSTTYDLLRDKPPCRLFGKIQYNSDAITRAIEDHIGVELLLLKK